MKWWSPLQSRGMPCRTGNWNFVYKLPPGNLQLFSGRKDLETKNAFTDESRRGSDSLLQHDKSRSTKEASVHRTNMHHACDHQKHLYLLSHVCLSALIHWLQPCDQHEPQKPFGRASLCTFCVLLATILLSVPCNLFLSLQTDIESDFSDLELHQIRESCPGASTTRMYCIQDLVGSCEDSSLHPLHQIELRVCAN